MDKQPLYNLDGYLRCLRRLNKNKCDYWVEQFEISGEVETSFSEYATGIDVKIMNCDLVGYREIEVFFEKEFSSTLKSLEEDQIKLFAWDVVEYIQMTFRGKDPDQDPIYKKHSFIASMKHHTRAQSDFHGYFRDIVVSVKDRATVVGVAARA
jgi:hypothetical protein